MHRFAWRLVTLGCSAALAIGSAGCGVEVSSEVSVEETGDTTVTTLDWVYDDWNVTISVTLSTVVNNQTQECHSLGRLVVDKVTAFKDISELQATPCDTLRLTDVGDIVLMNEATEHSWSDETLAVNKDDRELYLGPIIGSDASEYSFMLAGPPCEDEPSCDCMTLSRFRDEEATDLDLGRDCD